MPYDKKVHFIGGLASAVTVGFIVEPLAGLLAAAMLGAAKEFWDSQGHGTVELADFLYTVGGGVVGFLAAYIFLGR